MRLDSLWNVLCLDLPDTAMDTLGSLPFRPVKRDLADDVEDSIRLDYQPRIFGTAIDKMLMLSDLSFCDNDSMAMLKADDDLSTPTLLAQSSLAARAKIIEDHVPWYV